MVGNSYLDELAADSWLIGLDSSGRSESGILFLESEGRAVGSILFERGRVCWALGPDPSLDPFVEKIASRSELSQSALRTRLARCRMQRLPIWETLLAEEGLSDAILRDAVREHCVDVFLQIEREQPSERRWLERPELGARYAIPMVELVSEVAKRRIPAIAADVCRNLDQLAERGLGTMAFVDGLPHCPKNLTLSWPEMVELYHWATDELAAARRITERRVLIARSELGCVVLAPRGRVLYVAFCEAHHLGRLLAAVPPPSAPCTGLQRALTDEGAS